MLRAMFGQLLSGLVLVGILVGWWLAAGRDFGVMASQAYGVIMSVGSLFEPVIGSIFNSTDKAAASIDALGLAG